MRRENVGKIQNVVKTQNSQENVLKIVGNKTNQHILKKVLVPRENDTEKAFSSNVSQGV